VSVNYLSNLLKRGVMKFKLGILKKPEHMADDEAYINYYNHGAAEPEEHPDKSRQYLHSGVVKYKCPMGCEDDKTYDSPGNCPVCNMKLVPARKLLNEPVGNKIVK
jgi:hypothetical protein